MSPRIALLTLALAVAGCTDRTGPEPPIRAPSSPPPAVRQGASPAARDARERLARRLAHALANAELRRQVKDALGLGGLIPSLPATKEITDRTEGKAPQRVEVSGQVQQITLQVHAQLCVGGFPEHRDERQKEKEVLQAEVMHESQG